MIPLSRTSLSDADIAAASKVIESGMLVQGDHVAQFEKIIGEISGARYAVALSSCTAALHTSLLGLGTGPGDLVIVPTYSWPATANVVDVTRAEPIFVDIDPETYNISVNQLENALRHLDDFGRLDNLRAIIVVHAFGTMADNPEILDLANRVDIPVIEDAACALGAEQDGRPAGTWGALGCFSFHPRKLVTTGEGGAIVTDDPDLAAFAREFRDHGRRHTGVETAFAIAGLNYRLTDFQAALGIGQLERLPETLDRRRKLARNYRSLLADFPLGLPVDKGTASTWQSFVVQLEAGTDRDSVINELAARDIEGAIGTIALPLTDHFSRLELPVSQSLDVVTEVSKQSLALPLYTTMGESDQEQVAEALDQILST